MQDHERLINLVEHGIHFEEAIQAVEDEFPVKIEEMKYSHTYDDHGNGEITVVYQLARINGPVHYVEVYRYVEGNEQNAQLVKPVTEIITRFVPIN